MAKRIKIKTQEDFEVMLQERDLVISKAIVDTALKNLNNTKRYIPVLEIHVEDDGSVFDITLDRQDMVSTLEQNLEIHEYHEDYEGCAKIINAIKEIKSNG